MGLIARHYLTQQARTHVVLEKDRQVGSAWRHGRSTFQSVPLNQAILFFIRNIVRCRAPTKRARAYPDTHCDGALMVAFA